MLFLLIYVVFKNLCYFDRNRTIKSKLVNRANFRSKYSDLKIFRSKKLRSFQSNHFDSEFFTADKKVRTFRTVQIGQGLQKFPYSIFERLTQMHL